MVRTIRDHEQVVAVFTEALLYGLYASTLLLCFRWLLFSDDGWKPRKSIKWHLVSVTIIIFLLTAAHLGITLTSTTTIIYAASYLPPNAPHPAPVWCPIIQFAAENLTVLLADSVLIHRFWIVHNRTICIILLPITLWVGGFICTVLQTYIQITHALNTPTHPSSQEHIYTTAVPKILLSSFWCSTAILNSYCTVLLIYKIHRTAKASVNVASIRQFCPVICVLAESGFIYIVTTIAYSVVWFTENDVAITITRGFNLPLIGIAFNLILIRTGQNRADQNRLDLSSHLEQSVSVPLGFMPEFSPTNRSSFGVDDIVDDVQSGDIISLATVANLA